MILDTEKVKEKKREAENKIFDAVVWELAKLRKEGLQVRGIDIYFTDVTLPNDENRKFLPSGVNVHIDLGL